MKKNIEKERWNEKEVKRAAKIILNAEKNKHVFIKILDKIVHWLILFVILLGNVLIAAFIVFISLLLNEIYFYIITALFAISFGFLIEIPLRDVQKLNKQNHSFSRIILAILAILNIFVLMGMKNSIEYLTGIIFEFNAILVGIIYSVFFLLPSLIGLVVRIK